MVEEANLLKGKLESQPVVSMRTLHSSDILPGTISQRSLHRGFIIFRGNVADKPSNGGTQIQVYFSTDENKLYIWNPVDEAWVSVTLS